jgi:hypothetical protein
MSHLDVEQTSSGMDLLHAAEIRWPRRTIQLNRPHLSVVIATAAICLGVISGAEAGRSSPDLVISKLSSPPASIEVGASFSVSARAANKGDATASKTSTRFYFSADAKHDKSDLAIGAGAVKRLKAGKASRGRIELRVPESTAPGTYFVTACADGARKQKEESERNNCRASRASTTVTVRAGALQPPDLSDADGDGVAAPDDCNDADPATHPGAVDKPDLAFRDSNCDGIDGVGSAAIFVALDGDDANPGTASSPKRTLAAAIDGAAAAVPPRDVYVAAGVYAEELALVDGVSVYGKYLANTWTRPAASSTTIAPPAGDGDVEAGLANEITTPTELQLVSLVAPATSAPGADVYGLRAVSSPALRLNGVSVSAGNAGPGGDGAPAIDGAGGEDGEPGDDGSCDGSTPGAGGPGGVDPVGNFGGDGGTGGAEGSNGGIAGDDGSGGALGGPGGSGGDPGGDGDDGDPGAPGRNGSDGAGGSGGTVVNALWITEAGAGGTGGIAGKGGGGGGGGGGQGGGVGVNDGAGNGGGGGGAGGEGGPGGDAGQGGGGSFGLFLVDSTGIAISNSSIASANGGAGGDGSPGGAGGPGGTGGPGATHCAIEIGEGGSGGAGGDGGAGGAGGGGAGGASYGIFTGNTAAALTATTLSHGDGGAAGASAGTAGSPGASGDQN